MSYVIEHDKKKITLPDFKSLPVGVIRKARKIDPDEAIWFVLEEILSPEDLAVVDSMAISEFTEAMNGWTQGAPLGESSQSSS